jgi:quercetin dioxygenase-like cupin family protein
MKLTRRRVLSAALGLTVVGSGVALASPPSGIVSTNPVATKADLNRPVNLRSDGIRFNTKGPTDVGFQTVTFDPGGRTGWHHHPGVVIVTVQSGAVTIVDSDCHARTYGPNERRGSAFTESGNEPMEVRNLSGAPATVQAVLIAPDAEPPVFRIEDDVVPCP